MASTDFDSVTLQGTTYKVPKADANPPWGEELNAYLLALAAAFSTVAGPADIQETAATVTNNQVVAADIVGLTFDPAVVRGAFIDYVIYRSTSTTVAKEAGELILLFDAAASMGSKWQFTRESNGDAGVTLTVTDGGQIQFTSTALSGTGYTAKMIFRARGILQS